MPYENLASQAKQAVIRGEQSELYRITRDLSGKFQGECDAVKDKDGRESQSRINSYKDGQRTLGRSLTDQIQQSGYISALRR